MVDWGKINSKIFEDLAYDYVSNKYPEIHWKPTKATRDGNKDGEISYIAPLDVTFKYWYEAKYSKSTDKSIHKSHLDSTLVSCLLDGKVVFLAFITNAYISEDYRRRSDVFSKQRDNLRIIYINGKEIEEWLCDNPDIEKKYFSVNSAQRQGLDNRIESSCILQNYDLYGNQFTKVKSIECGKEYTLYLSFYSTCKQIVSIYSKDKAVELLSNEERKYDQYDELNADFGFNSFYIPIKIVSILDAPLLFTLSCDSKNIDFAVKDVSIIDIYNPQIIYGSQIEIQRQIFSSINDRDITNAIFCITGNAGSGKSFLLNNIYNDSMNPFSSYVISFSEDEIANTVNCYRMMILSLYGDIWEYMDDIKNIKQINEIETLMMEQIKSSKLYGNSIEQVISYYENRKDQIERNAAQTQIFVDDFHKLSYENNLLLEAFFKWFIKQKYNCKIFVFSRPETEFPNSYTRKLTIKNIEPNDIEATIKQNFKSHKYLPSLLKKYPIPLNALHFVNLLCKIHYAEDDFSKLTNVERQILLNEIYAGSQETTCLSFGNQIVSDYKDNSIVYCVYKIKTGISIDAIIEYFGETAAEEIYDLCQKRIFKESSNIISPYHDILASAFDTLNSNRMNKVLEKFVLFAQKNNYVSKAKMFSVLIVIGKHCFWKYRKDAALYRDKLHECAEYYQAMGIAKALEESNSKSLGDYDLDDCRNQFVIANCIKYTSSYENANREFEKIKSVYELTNNFDIYGLYMEAETEIINNMIWMLDVRTAKKRLENLSATIKDLYSHNQIAGHNLIYAFLNYYNRLMFVNYMIDEGTIDDYNNAIKYSKELKREEYVAFAKMDYAKSLYYENLAFAQTLMDEALNSLNDCNEQRRLLDAESEKCFINDIINRTISYDNYLDLKEKARQNHYIQSNIKIQLKIIMLKLLWSDISPDEIRNQIDSIVVNNTAISSGKRHQAFINHLYAAAFYKENNIGMSKKHSLICLDIMKDMGESYKGVHRNNSQLIEFNGFITLNELANGKDVHNTNKFIFDIRVW